MADLDKLDQFIESVRIMQFDVPLSSLREGNNQIELSVKTGGNQKLLWLEVSLSPKP